MCTSIVVNKKKTIVGFNLDIIDMKYRIRDDEKGFYVEIYDKKEGFLPLFGANNRGDFVAMPTCWPFDERSNPTKDSYNNSLLLDIDLLLQKKTFEEVKEIAFNNRISSVPGFTFMSSLSNRNGDVLHIIPGQGYKYYEKPEYKVLTNFSPFKGDKEKHPWMGLLRYKKAELLLKKASDDFDVNDCFEVLKACSQDLCPTKVSIVFDATKMKVYWCIDRNYQDIKTKNF